MFSLLREKKIEFIMPAKVKDSHFESAKQCKELPAVFQAYEDK